MATFEAIASTTLGSDTATITFSSIPATYEHLQIRIYARESRSATWGWVYARFNSDTGSNYVYHRLYGDGSSPLGNGVTGQTSIPVGLTTSNNSTANCFGVSVIDIVDYASTNKYKTTRSICGQDQNTTSGSVYLFSGLWLSTTSIDTVGFSPATGNWKTGSVFSLYGLRSS